MDLKKFLSLNAAGAMLYAPLWIWLSAVAGERFARTPAAAKVAEQWVGQGSMVLIGLVLLIACGLIWGAGRKKA